MGLFDGATDREGSTADLAVATGWPVVLVVDVRAQAASAAAVVRGFATHRPEVSIAAVVFNRVGGERHAALLREACALAVPDVPVAGCLPRAEGLVLPERHLGLVQAVEHPHLDRLPRPRGGPRGHARRHDFAASAGSPRPADGTGRFGIAGATARPTHRGGGRRRVRLPLPVDHRGLASGGRRDLAILPARRRGAGGGRRRRLSPRRLSRAPRRPARRERAVPGRAARRRPAPSGDFRRMRRLHGDGRRLDRRLGREPRDGRPAAAGNVLRRPAAASRLSRRVARRATARWDGRERAFAATNSTTRARCARVLASRCSPAGMPTAGCSAPLVWSRDESMGSFVHLIDFAGRGG